MGSRPSTFKRGGGFLNDVNATLLDYQWTDEFNGEEFKAGKIKSYDGKGMIEKPHSLNCFVSFLVDGAEEPTTVTLKAAGEFDDYAVDETGHVLTAAEGGECNIPANSAAGKFWGSLIPAGFPEASLSEDPNLIDFTPTLGSRVRLIQRVDAERTKKFGQKVDKKDPKKKYDRKDLVVETVLGLPEAVETPVATRPTPVAASKTKTTSPSKGKAAKPAAAPEPEVDVPSLAASTLLDILSEKPKLTKNQLSMQVLTKLMKAGPVRETVRTWLFNDGNLETLAGDGLIQFNKAKGEIQAVAAE